MKHRQAQLPQGWEIKKLGEIADYFIGLTYSPKDVSDKGIVVLRSSNIQNDKLDFSDIVRVNRPIKDHLKVKDGDILMCSRNGSKRLVGKTATIQGLEEKMTFGTFMTIIRSQYNTYLSWFFKSDEFREQIGGGENPMINQITKYMLDDLVIPLPPLSEQQHIVAILIEAYASIAKAEAYAEQNLKNAKELFESYLQSVFANKGDGWEEKNLGEVCEFVRGPFGGSLKKNIFKLHGYAIYEQQHAINNQFNDIRYFIDDNKFNEMKRFELNPGDLIMSCSGTMGKTAIVPKDIKKGIINQALLKLTPSKKLSVVFLKLWMQSENFQDRLKEYSQGAAIQNVASVKILKGIKIPLPTLISQESIVQNLNALSAETKKLEAIYQQKLNDLEELKKSVLQKAFNGELKTTKAEAV